jgi:hypothetical protein
LEIKDETAFKEWCTNGLKVEYSGRQHLVAEDRPQEDGSHHFMMTICPLGYNKDDDCPIVLSLISSHGETCLSSHNTLVCQK